MTIGRTQASVIGFPDNDLFDGRITGDEGAELGASIDVDAATAAQVAAASLVDELPDGSSALVFAIEYMWAVPARNAFGDAGGFVLAHRSLTPEELVGFGMDVRDELADANAEG